MRFAAALLLAASLSFIGCSDTSSPEAAVLTASNKIEMNISGMECTSCSSSVCSAIEQVAGVTGAVADVKTGNLTIALEDSVDASEKKIDIANAIIGLADGKYTVNTITIEGNPNAQPTPIKPATPSDATPQDAPAAQEQSSAVSEAHVFTSYKVTGMDCTSCSSAIVAAVKEVDGVLKADADHTTGLVSVWIEDRFDDKKKTDEIKNLIAGLSNGKYAVTY